MARKPADIPPLVSFSITNPIEYIQRWWNAIVGNEGIKMTIQIKPLTGIFMVTVISGIGFGFGKITWPPSIIKYMTKLDSSVIAPTPTPTPTPDPWRETAFIGKLQTSQGKYYLVTSASEAITLKVPPEIYLSSMVGKRIMAVGLYNKTIRVLMVTEATDMEILPPKPIPVPTTTPSP